MSTKHNGECQTGKTPLILCHETTWPGFSLFSPNEWGSKSRPIILSSAANYGLILYCTRLIESVFSKAEALCQPMFDNLQNQWKKSKWKAASCTYLVDAPEVHLSIHAFLSATKTFLDIFVQLLYSEEVVNIEIHGFHKKGDAVGGKVLGMLENNVQGPKKHIAENIHGLIREHKKLWIDSVVEARDQLTHPQLGLSCVMLSLDLYEANGELILGKVQVPTFRGEVFSVFARNTLSMLETFSIKCMDYLKGK
jgi:hypothetical protein